MMNMARLLIGLLLLVLLGAPAHAAKRVALVIGNSAYEHVPILANPKNDADSVSASLERLDFTVVKGVDLNRLEFEQKVREFSRAMKGAEIALLYYAGHGLQVNGQNFLAPIDTKLVDEADLDFETIELNTIMKQMEREPRTNLVFLDACRNNPMARNLALSMGTRSASVGRGLAPIETGIGTLIAFATQPGNVALDGEGSNSPFTEAFVKHIETPGADIGVLMRRVRQEVIENTKGKQVPWDNSSLTGSVVLKPAAKPKSNGTAEAAAKLRLQLQEMQEQLKQAQEELSERRRVSVKEAPAGEDAAGAKKSQAKEQLPNGKGPAKVAALPPSETQSESQPISEAKLAAQDYEIARNIDAQRGWQLFIRKHGNDPVFGPLALEKLNTSNSSATRSAALEKAQDHPGLGRSSRIRIQTALNARGHDVGVADGVFGPKTRNAIKDFQRNSGVTETGFADTDLLELLKIDVDELTAETFISDKEARIYDPEYLSTLNENQVIIDTITCLGDRRLLIYGQRENRLYFGVLGKTDSRSQRILADKCGGKLAILEDADTNRFVYGLFSSEPRFFRTRYDKRNNVTEKYGPTIGLRQDAGAYEPSGGWNWLDGNKSRFRNWFRGQPSNTNGYSSSARFYAQARGKPEMANVDASRWGDFPAASHAFVMQIELSE